MDKSTLKSKIDIKEIIIKVTFALICPTSNPNNEKNKVKWEISKSLTHDKSLRMIVNQLESNDMFK